MSCIKVITVGRDKMQKQGRRKLLESGCAIYIFAYNSVNFWRIFKILFSVESLFQVPFCQKMVAQLRTLRTQFRHPWQGYDFPNTRVEREGKNEIYAVFVAQKLILEYQSEPNMNLLMLKSGSIEVWSDALESIFELKKAKKQILFFLAKD